MKKIFIAASMVLASFCANAQDESFKPTAGDVTAEFSVNGLINNIQLGLNNGNLRFRYFLADQLAARVGLNITRESEKELVQSGSNIGEIKSSFGQIALNLGVEKHFSGTERLSTYAGADLLLSFTSVKEEGTDVTVAGGYQQGDSYELKGAIVNSDLTLPANFNAGTGIGLRVVAGADYYFVKKVYIGGELGWGFLATNIKDVEATVSTAGVSTSTTTEVGSAFSLAPQVVGNIRVGFRF